MPFSDYFSNYFTHLYDRLQTVNEADLLQVAELTLHTHQQQKKIIVAGNGGSAAMASHVSVDFTKAAGIRAINFNESDLLTCFANDYGYERWVEVALGFYADPGDLAILISSSGQSSNMINGAEKAKAMGLSLITVSGFSPDNPLRKLGDVNLWVNSKTYNIVEMTHHIWLLSIIDYLVEMKDSVQ